MSPETHDLFFQLRWLLLVGGLAMLAWAWWWNADRAWKWWAFRGSLRGLQVERTDAWDAMFKVSRVILAGTAAGSFVLGLVEAIASAG